MKCKFCGCTDNNACRVPVMFDEQEPGGAAVWAGDPEKADGYRPCYWIAPEICCNPECVKQAYDEARPFFGGAVETSPLIILPDQCGLSQGEIDRGMFRL